MAIKYFEAPEIKEKVEKIILFLGLLHVKPERVFCFRSAGTNSKRVIARCYALGKIWQKALDTRSHYIIEVVSERYDNLSKDEKEMVLIHELLHIPKAFGGGLVPHKGRVTESKVRKLHKLFKEQAEEKEMAKLEKKDVIIKNIKEFLSEKKKLFG